MVEVRNEKWKVRREREQAVESEKYFFAKRRRFVGGDAGYGYKRSSCNVFGVHSALKGFSLFPDEMYRGGRQHPDLSKNQCFNIKVKSNVIQLKGRHGLLAGDKMKMKAISFQNLLLFGELRFARKLVRFFGQLLERV